MEYERPLELVSIENKLKEQNRIIDSLRLELQIKEEQMNKLMDLVAKHGLTLINKLD